MCRDCKDRRDFIKLGATSLMLLGLPRVASLAEALAGPVAASDRSGKGVLVVFFQRGAADGLHMVAPYRESSYRQIRGALALKEPGSAEERTLDLGGGFAFHPALAPLLPLYREGRLAVVHAVGSPDTTRSHFDAQDYMESGTPGVKSTRDGWLSRALAGLPGAQSEKPNPFSAVALSSTLPRSLAGASHAIAMQDFSRMSTRSRTPTLLDKIERMYVADHDPEFAQAGEEAFRAMQVFREKNPLAQPVGEGVRYPAGRVSSAFKQLARLLKADLGIRIAFLEGGGWDTHFAQGGATGQMANNLRELAGSLAAFLQDLGSDFPVTLMTVTEFGRTVAPNGAGGTDHGHGTAMLVMGDGVRGGRVVGDWPGLSPRHLFEGRDLAVTTDFRDLFLEVATRALGLPKAVTLFPGYRVQRLPGVMA